MTERLFQFIWQFQYYNKGELAITAGESLLVINPGQLNSNQGPDFLDARIMLGNTTWAGTIELHVKSSDWQKHRHDQDLNYATVILHVVWEDDLGKSGNSVPVLELKERVSRLLLTRYEDLMFSTSFIPCEKMIASIPQINFRAWKERLLVERLIRKSSFIEGFLAETNFHWEEAFWWMLARNFGTKVNAGLFEEIARSVPLAILARHKNQLIQLEAILFGQAGLLGRQFVEDYPRMLSREYAYYRRKYRMQQVHQRPQFLRMRPGNFPTVRLAQLAALVHHSIHMFSKLKEISSAAEFRKMLEINANDYWHYHYRFDELSPHQPKRLGELMADNIIINTAIPMLFAYGSYYSEEQFREKALQWLEGTRAETNTTTRCFSNIGVPSASAYDSQALIELKSRYCDAKRCLECGVGNSILKGMG